MVENSSVSHSSIANRAQPPTRTPTDTDVRARLEGAEWALPGLQQIAAIHRRAAEDAEQRVAECRAEIERCRRVVGGDDA